MDSVAGMRIFVSVVETGSFSAAGRHMGLAPSSVSRRIGDLEYELGAHLFYRTTRKLSLTEAGRLYHERVLRILIDIDEARLAVSQLDGTPSGILRLTVPSGIGRYLAAAALPIFLDRFPAVKVVVSMTDRLVDLVEEGIDLAVRVGPQQDSSLIARKIGESRRIVSAGPDYLKRKGEPREPRDLEDHNCLTFRAHPGSNIWRFRGPDGLTDIRASGSFFATNADILISAATAGMGIVLLPDWNISSELNAGTLRPVLPDHTSVPAVSAIYAVYPDQRQLLPKVRALIDYLIDHFAAGGLTN